MIYFSLFQNVCLQAESKLATVKSDNERYRRETEEQLVRLQQYIHELEAQLEEHKRSVLSR